MDQPAAPTSPIIVQNTQPSLQPEKKFTMPANLGTFIFLILIIGIIGEVVWGIWYITRPLPMLPGALPPQTVQAQEESKAMLTLSGPTSVSVGEQVLVDINLSSNQVDSFGTDIILEYDPTALLPIGTAQTAFVAGAVYPTYLGQTIDNQKGIVKVSGISNDALGEVADGNFGQIKFKALKKGMTTVTVQFQKGNTTDSNVVDAAGEDILDSVTSLNLEVI